MADALASGASVRKDVGVQVPPSAPRKSTDFERIQYFFFFLNFRLGFLTTNRQQNRLLPDAAQPLWAANRKRRSVRSVFLRSIRSVPDRVLDQRRDAEAMAVPILLRRLRIGKVHMPAAAHVDRAAGAAVELMEMVFIEIRAEAHLMHMVTVAQRDRLAAHRREPVVVRIGILLRDLHAAHDLMHMALRPAVTAAHMAAVYF